MSDKNEKNTIRVEMDRIEFYQMKRKTFMLI